MDKLIPLAKTRPILQNRTDCMELKLKPNKLKLKAEQLKLEKLKLLTRIIPFVKTRQYRLYGAKTKDITVKI